ncbi:MAG: c-type cytochrome, partial [Halobacteriovoraceae bacterium]|nr:c-type cytochrome [Halobacteriovoraceae bacterium]
YTEYCMPCHGVKGDGKGVSSKGLTVPPRDFTKGLYKFGRVEAGGLPRDEDFYRIIKEGLHGTAMIPWDMGKGQMRAVVQYLKTFAPDVWEGKDKTLGKPIIPVKDPYGIARKESGIERGKEVYHVLGECQTCHRGYISKDEFVRMYKKNNGSLPDFDDTFYQIKLQESEYGHMTVPPDFTWHEVRSTQTVEDLFVRISAGVGGTSMPGWQDTLEDDDIWAVAYYVKSLMEKKGKMDAVREINNVQGVGR